MPQPAPLHHPAEPALEQRLRQGRIAKHYESVDPNGHSAVVLADIKELKARAAAASQGGR